MVQRKEKYNSESRIPIIEKGCLLDDSNRRDFTINSMYYNLITKKLEDPTNEGLKDLEKKLIKSVGK